jgi:hypothetical protein
MSVVRERKEEEGRARSLPSPPKTFASSEGRKEGRRGWMRSRRREGRREEGEEGEEEECCRLPKPLVRRARVWVEEKEEEGKEDEEGEEEGERRLETWLQRER